MWRSALKNKIGIFCSVWMDELSELLGTECHILLGYWLSHWQNSTTLLLCFVQWAINDVFGNARLHLIINALSKYFSWFYWKEHHVRKWDEKAVMLIVKNCWKQNQFWRCMLGNNPVLKMLQSKTKTKQSKLLEFDTLLGLSNRK